MARRSATSVTAATGSFVTREEKSSLQRVRRSGYLLGAIGPGEVAKEGSEDARFPEGKGLGERPAAQVGNSDGVGTSVGETGPLVGSTQMPEHPGTMIRLPMCGPSSSIFGVSLGVGLTARYQ